MRDGIPIQGRVYTRDGEWYLSLDLPRWGVSEIWHKLDSHAFRIVNCGSESMMMVQVKDVPSPDAEFVKALRELRSTTTDLLAMHITVKPDGLGYCLHWYGEETGFHATRDYDNYGLAIQEYHERKGRPCHHTL